MTTYTWGLTTPTPTPPPAYPASSLPAADVVSALLAEPFRDPQSFPSVFCTAIANQLAELPAVFAEIKNILNVSEQEGAQLDLIGRILGRPREGLSDAQYIAFLLAQASVLRSTGTYEELVAIFTQILAAFGANPFTIVEYFPKMFILRITGILTADPTALATVLRESREAGVEGLLEYSLASDATTFTLGGTAAQGFGNGFLIGMLR